MTMVVLLLVFGLSFAVIMMRCRTRRTRHENNFPAAVKFNVLHDKGVLFVASFLGLCEAFVAFERY